ncbi:MAG: twin-arginine translocase TatA/TatE family subunit [Phycisphaera sp.]|nr:MAG: twin-arginine translocase TatA/TatE family subunit [Phycisphaera sp.]
MPMPAISTLPLALIGPLGPVEIGAILIVAVLLFGRRLPDVGRNVGRSIIEFKRGVKGITDEIEEESRKPDAREREGERSVAAPELEAPKGTAYRGDAFHDVPPAGDVGRPDAVPARPADPPSGEGQPRTT